VPREAPKGRSVGVKIVVLSFFKKTGPKNLLTLSKSEEELFDILLKKGYLTPSQYKDISFQSERLQKSKREVVWQNGWVSDERLALAYSTLYDIPVVHLPPQLIPYNIISKIPKEVAMKLQIIPFGAEDGYIKIGVVDPFRLSDNRTVLEQVFLQNKIVPSFYIIPRSDFQRASVQFKREPSLIPQITLAGIELPYKVVAKLPEQVARKYKMLVFGYAPNELLKFAVVNPSDPKVIEILDFIERRTGLKVERYQTTEEDLERALKSYENIPVLSEVRVEKVTEQPEKPKKPSIVIEKVSAPEEEMTALLKKDISDIKELEEIVKSGHVPKIVAALINFACQKRATDIHVQPYEKELLIRYRVDGLLRDMIHIPKDLQPAIVSRIKILAKLKIDEQRIPQDGRFDLKFRGREVDVRVSTLPTANGEKAVLRLLDKGFGILTLEQLGLQGKGFQDLIREIGKPHGVILATGPTGCGKSTTLYAIINRIKNPTVNIVTLEDPVEYKIEGINQSQIKPEINYTFATGLRSIVRQDPNIIMVGEIRDAETASLVTHAALTGHLVLTTLHTNDASSALPRLINMGVEPFLITSAINAIIAQRLLRRVCPKCQEPAKLTPAVIAEIEKEVAKMPKGTLEGLNIKKPYSFRKGRGCDECDNGYKGRIGIFEILVMSSSIEELAIRRRPSSEIQEVAQREGMLTMKQDGILKVLQGLTTYDEVLRVIAVE